MMNIRIYQINHERDINQAMFMNTEYLAHKFDEVKPDSSSYDLVFEGKVDRNTLEGVYQMFNLEQNILKNIWAQVNLSSLKSRLYQ